MSDPNRRGELYCPTCEQTYAVGTHCPKDATRFITIATPIDPLLGRQLDGRYKILERIGAGGMGTVYRGTQHSVGRDRAIKVVTPSLVSEPVAIKRFMREARLASQLAHNNVVSIVDFGQTEDGLFFLVMELLTGRTLDEVLAQDGALPPARVIKIGVQICHALEAAHALEIVHRDLKPSNVMVLALGPDLVKVLDFGLAKSLSPQSGVATTQAGALLGTPAYMPPELITGASSDGRADLYSLGCMLYELASGRLPFPGATVHEQISMHVNDRPAPLNTVPRRLASAIERMLEKSPSDRFASAAQARHALEDALRVDDPLDEPVYGSTIPGWSGIFNDTVRSPKDDVGSSDVTEKKRLAKSSEPGWQPDPASPLAGRLGGLKGPASTITSPLNDDADPTVPDQLGRREIKRAATPQPSAEGTTQRHPTKSLRRPDVPLEPERPSQRRRPDAALEPERPRPDAALEPERPSQRHRPDAPLEPERPSQRRAEPKPLPPLSIPPQRRTFDAHTVVLVLCGILVLIGALLFALY